MRLFLLFLCVFLSKVLNAEQLNVTIASGNAILINAETGRVLYDKKASQTCFPASLTKIATAIYAIKIGSHLLEDTFMATPEALRSVPDDVRARNNYRNYPPYCLETRMTHVGIKKDEEMKFKDLLYALMLSSAGDAGNVIAATLGHGSIERFVQGMNRFLHSIGCNHTHFCNPSGQQYPDHVTTAKDLATLCRYAMKDSFFRQIVRTLRYDVPVTNKQPARILVQSNRLIKKGKFYYPYAIGIKTGYTAKATYTLAAAANKDGRQLIAVLLNCTDRNQRFADAKTLFEAAFRERQETKEIVHKGEQEFAHEIKGAEKLLKTYSKEPLTVSYFPSEEPQIRCLLHWGSTDGKSALTLPISKGQKVGELRLMADDKLVNKVDLFAKESVERSSFAAFCHALVHVATRPLSIIGLVGLILVALYWAASRRTK